MLLPWIDDQCRHRHYSGRRCPQLVKLYAEHCGLHKPGAVCKECAAMLAVFPIRKTLREGDSGSL